MILVKKIKDFDKNNLINLIFILIFLGSLILSLVTFLMLSGYLSNPQDVEKISFLISVNFSLILILIVISIVKIIDTFIKKKKEIRSNLRIQFTSLFIFITFIPTTIVTLFSLLFFDQGIKLWFNERLSKVVKGSQTISESYFSEHTKSIKNDILHINSEINNEKIVFFTDKDRLNNFLSFFVNIQDLDEAIIFESSGQLLAKVGNFFIEDEPAPPLWSILIADDGDIAVFPNNEKTKVRALLKLQRVIPTYLYIGKNVDSNVLSRVESVNQAAEEYNNIEEKIDEFQYQFNKLFLAINFLMILLAMWFGLKFSNKIIEPILEIISASEKIMKGDLSTRIRDFKGYNDFNILSRVLNKMLDKLVKAKETINLRRKFTENIINDVSTGIIYIDLNNKILLHNKKSLEIFGKDIKKNFYKKNLEIIDLIKDYKIGSRKIIEKQIKYFMEGKLKILNLKISSEIEKKKIKGFILSIDDVTELVSAQKNAAWSNVARYMAHEIKNPLTPIKLSAQRLKSFLKNKNNLSNEAFLDCTDAIVRQVNNIEGLVSEFSNFARMPNAKFKTEKLENIIQMQITSQMLINKNIQIIYNSKSPSVSISCDYSQLSRVFLNLLKNSLESTKKRKKLISIEVINEKKFVIVNVEDNGNGFPPNNRDKLFEPYITKKVDGTGLGLSICKKIIEDHGGEITLLDSKKFGGALVKIKLFKELNIIKL